ncbi:alpha-galactosidase [Dinghuibacter silviterrae]|uniref:Alpha-galactosidase n=1 Tax=Dinghuibacter silviterrae TaxID=1539049 RepID=A0A4R8DIG1_9BACT|nr:alpha-galactosidase [Dinghuibacter silviterrae]TDW97531.1 hypothetical protein EDB95_5381 [Dinghuibacter silviterrae]
MRGLAGLAIFWCLSATAQTPQPPQPVGDWLLGGTYKATVQSDFDRREVILDNGLARRRFLVMPNAACVDFVDLVNGEQLLRAVTPEARLVLDGKTYEVGGLYGQREKAYLRASEINGLRAHPEDFKCTGWHVQMLTPPIQWVSRTWTGNPQQATGIELVLEFRAPGGQPASAAAQAGPAASAAMQDPSPKAVPALTVEVHYVLYDNLPLFCKWLILRNEGAPVKVDRVVNEILATPDGSSTAKPHGIYLESNYAFNGSMRYELSDQTAHWMADSGYTSQVNCGGQNPCLAEVYPDKGPGVILRTNDTLESVRTWELLMDSDDRERRGLAIRRMYRTIAPWTTQNPIFLHLISRKDEDVTTAVDQCVATGYEAVILSFGSHCNMEDTSAENIARWKKLAAYAHGKHILIGGYSLFSSRHISDSDDVIDPKTGKPGGAVFGFAPCYGSAWGLAYLRKIEYFLAATGFDIFENDGPYPGDVCASTTHPGHRGLEDSQWQQVLLQKSLYHWCCAHGVYVNAPDWYFLDGTNKIALGYREMNFTLPRDQQVILNRQNIYDGTWEKTPSMGWGFVPLTAYHEGGPEAVLEPLKDHLKDYRQLMVQYYGAGVQACYRGPRLYDTDNTEALVKRTILWYKKYRTILNADIIHLRRPDGRDWDGILHVDPKGAIKGFLMLYNPLPVSLTRTITVPLYYTGLSGVVRVREQEGVAKTYAPGRDGNLHLRVVLPPDGFSWYTIE